MISIVAEMRYMLLRYISTQAWVVVMPTEYLIQGQRDTPHMCLDESHHPQPPIRWIASPSVALLPSKVDGIIISGREKWEDINMRLHLPHINIHAWIHISTQSQFSGHLGYGWWRRWIHFILRGSDTSWIPFPSSKVFGCWYWDLKILIRGWKENEVQSSSLQPPTHTHFPQFASENRAKLCSAMIF